MSAHMSLQAHTRAYTSLGEHTSAHMNLGAHTSALMSACICIFFAPGSYLKLKLPLT